MTKRALNMLFLLVTPKASTDQYEYSFNSWTTVNPSGDDPVDPDDPVNPGDKPESSVFILHRRK